MYSHLGRYGFIYNQKEISDKMNISQSYVSRIIKNSLNYIKQNEKDLEDIPQEVKNNIEIILVNSYFEVYQEIFNKKKKN